MLINNEKNFYDKYDNLRNFIDITIKALRRNNYQYNENNERVFKDLNIDDIFIYNNSWIYSAYCNAISQYLRIERESPVNEIFSLINEIVKEAKEGEYNSYSFINNNCHSVYYTDTSFIINARFNDQSLFIEEALHGGKIFFDISYSHNQQGYKQFNLSFEFSPENGIIENANKSQSDLTQALKNICYLISHAADKEKLLN